MTLKIKLTEAGLFVNKYKCRSITIYQTKEGYKGEMFDIKGITKRIPKMTKWGTQEKYFDGKPIYKTLRLKKTIKSKTFEYSGIALKNSNLFDSDEYKQYKHAINSKKEYINLYLLE